MRTRFGEVARHEFHDHKAGVHDPRAALDGLENPIVVVGDSITEMTHLPCRFAVFLLSMQELVELELANLLTINGGL